MGLLVEFIYKGITYSRFIYREKGLGMEETVDKVMRLEGITTYSWSN